VVEEDGVANAVGSQQGMEALVRSASGEAVSALQLNDLKGGSEAVGVDSPQGSQAERTDLCPPSRSALQQSVVKKDCELGVAKVVKPFEQVRKTTARRPSKRQPRTQKTPQSKQQSLQSNVSSVSGGTEESLQSKYTAMTATFCAEMRDMIQKEFETIDRCLCGTPFQGGEGSALLAKTNNHTMFQQGQVHFGVDHYGLRMASEGQVYNGTVAVYPPMFTDANLHHNPVWRGPCGAQSLG
jgi:hypothetical protein